MNSPCVAALDADHVIHRLGQNVKRVRTEAGLSQDLLAARCGKFRRQIPGIEAGTVTATFSMLIALAKALDVEPAVLMVMDPSPDGQ